MKAYLIAITLVVALPGGLHAQRGSQPQQGNDRPASQQDRNAATSDASFIAQAGESGKAELALAEVAQRRAEDARVRAYAALLHKDHTANQAALQSLASSKSVNIPEPGRDKEQARATLEKLSGPAFDRGYLGRMVEDHEAAIELYEKAASGSTGEVRDLAQKTLPVLKSHLTEAQRLLDIIGSNTAGGAQTGPR